MNKNDKDKDKLRVYEYAKTLNMSSKEIIEILNKTGTKVANHMSVMENDMVDKVEQFFKEVREKAAARRAQQNNANKPAGAQANASSAQGKPSAAPSPAAKAMSQVNQQAKSDAPNVQQAAKPAQKPASQVAPQAAQQNASSAAPKQPAASTGQSASNQAVTPKAEAPKSEAPKSEAPKSEAPKADAPKAEAPKAEAPKVDATKVEQTAAPVAKVEQPSVSKSEQAPSHRGTSSDGQGGNRDFNRGPRSDGQGGNRDFNRGPRPDGQGGNRDFSRGPRPDGQGGNRDFNRGPRPDGQGGGNRDFNRGPRPDGQGGGNRDFNRGPRPDGQGGGNRDFNRGPRPDGQGGGNRDFNRGPRPDGQGGGNRDFNRGPRPDGQGGNRPAAKDHKSTPEKKAPLAVVAAAREAVKPKSNQPTKYDRADFLDETLDDRNLAQGASKQKKNKANQKRFDDNKLSGMKPGQSHKAQKLQQKSRYGAIEQKEKVDTSPKKIVVRGSMTVSELASAMHKTGAELVKKLFVALGVMATVNQELDLDTIQLLATEYNVEVEMKIAVEDDQFENEVETDDEVDLETRPPVVTIMGHVDHGKTTLLDAIRETNVTAGEAGGITQHIGAYQVEINQRKITFLDTPGHEAFTTMRARGAKVTDITILVVAADDGVMPQTVEAINHAKAAGVPIIVAVNKMDKPGANPEKVMQELTEHGLVSEDWGGDTIFVKVSAKKRVGLEELLEMILLVADVQDLKANPNKRARGTVLEAELDKGRGPVARVLIQNGTLKVGDAFIAGVCFGRVRAMVNDKGRRVKEAEPCTPVEITGLTEVPRAGDPLMAYEDERKARSVAEIRASKLRLSEMGANTRVTLDDLHKMIQQGEMKDLNVIIKGDVQGSVEALRGSLEKIEVEGVRVRIIHYGVGAISESDVILASASNAIVIGFNVRPEAVAKATADREKVDLRLHRVIYDAIDEIETAMKGMLEPVMKETVLGHAEVRNLFKITKVGTIAGCMVKDGKITRQSELRIIRGGIVVYEGKIDSLKRFKDDAKEVNAGYECGISVERYNDLQEGDIIEAYVMEAVARV